MTARTPARPFAFTPEPYSVPIWPMSVVVGRHKLPKEEELRAIVLYLLLYRDLHVSYGPTLRELADAVDPEVGWEVVRNRVLKLIERGYVAKDKYKARSLRAVNLAKGR